MGSALDGIRVLDLTQGFAGPFGTKLLADFGADVVKIERPGGDPMRRAGPFPGDVAHPEKGGLFLYLNTNKRGVTLDLRDAADLERFRALATTADLVVESFRPGTLERLGIGSEALRAQNPELGIVSLSNFGATGPYRDWELTELVSFALAGPMIQNGLPDRAPIGYAERATLGFAGLALAAAAVAAVIGARRSGRGARMELSIAESFLAGGERQPMSFFYSGHVPGRGADELRSQYLVGAYPCGDGYVAVQGMGRGATWWPRVFSMMGQPELSDDPRFADEASIAENKPALDQVWLAWLAEHTRAEIFAAASSARFPLAPVYTPEDMHRDPHFVERGLFEEIDHPAAGPLRYPTKPFRLHGAEPVPPRPAPTLGQHDAEVFAEVATAPGEHADALPARDASAQDLPLAGVRVLELAEGWAGPMTGMWLADLGAEVIKVEACQRFDHARGPIEAPDGLTSYPNEKAGARPYDVSTAYVQANRNKLDISLDLSRPRGVELFKRLVEVSDVVVTNMVTGVPEKMGIGYDDLVAVRPDLVMLTCSGYGATGPYARYVTMGGAMDGIAGYTWLRHDPELTPDTVDYSTHTDVVTGLNNAIAVLMAIAHHQRTGEGQLVEVAGVEASLHQIPEALMDFAMNGRVHTARGNDHPAMAPHGVYPCRGEDRWIAITVYRDAQWDALCRAMGDPGWARDASFSDADSRRRHRAALDEKLAAWTRSRDSVELMNTLQAVGVPAGAVHDARQHAEDPHWRERGVYETGRLGDYGEFPLPTSPWFVDGRRLGVRRPAPSFAADNRTIFSGLLGLSEAEIAELEAERYIGDAPLPHDL